MQKNYMQDIPEDFISEMKEAFKLFDKVTKPAPTDLTIFSVS